MLFKVLGSPETIANFAAGEFAPERREHTFKRVSGGQRSGDAVVNGCRWHPDPLRD